MNQVQQRLLQQFKIINSGRAWYGKNLTETLAPLTAQQSSNRHGGNHNIAELLSHMCAWRSYVLRSIKVGYHTGVSAEANFSRIDTLTDEEWSDLLRRFEDLTNKLVILLEQPLDLNMQLTGKGYTYWELLQGIIHHDIYHAGQINLLATM